MAHQLDWLVERRVIVHRTWDVFNHAEMKVYVSQVDAMLNAGEPPIYLYEYAVDLNWVRPNIFELKWSFKHLAHPNLGGVVVCTRNRTIQMMANLLLQFSGQDIQIHSDREKALDHLKNLDDKLDWSQAHLQLLQR